MVIKIIYDNKKMMVQLLRYGVLQNRGRKANMDLKMKIDPIAEWKQSIERLGGFPGLFLCSKLSWHSDWNKSL